MEYKRYDDKIVLRLDKGDEITESVLKVAEKEKITAGAVSGIGATDDFTLGVFDVGKKDYDKFSFKGNREITALIGNISTMNKKTYVHLHLTTAGCGGETVGGHLIKAIVSLTAEIVISIIPAVIERKRNEELKINTLVF